MPGAIAVNAGALNIARTIGPALGDAVFAALGAFRVRHQRREQSQRHPRRAALAEADGFARPAPGALRNAMLAGLRYVALSPILVAITLRGAIFNFVAISIIALAPLVARDLLGGDAMTYGFLLGTFGASALVGTLSLNARRRRTSLESSANLCFIGFGVATILLATSATIVVSMAAIALAGCCWIVVQVNLNSAMQLSSPR